MPSDKKGGDKGKNPYFRIDKKGEISPTEPKPEPLERHQHTKTHAKEPSQLPISKGANETSDPLNPFRESENIVHVDEDDDISGFTSGIVANSPLDNTNNNSYKEQTKAPTRSKQMISELKPAVETIHQLNREETITPNQVDILKKYITLKELEVSDLKEQQRLYQAQSKTVRRSSEQLAIKNRELTEEVQAHRNMEDQLKIEIHDLVEKHQGELILAKNDFDDQIKKSGNFQEQMQELLRQKDIWKEKVREDLKRIKLKEKELENKYELLKRDTQTLLDSKDKQMLELKKKNDALEFEMETLEEKLRSGNAVFDSIESKKRRLVETMRLAIALLEEIDGNSSADPKRKLG